MLMTPILERGQRQGRASQGRPDRAWAFVLAGERMERQDAHHTFIQTDATSAGVKNHFAAIRIMHRVARSAVSQEKKSGKGLIVMERRRSHEPTAIRNYFHFSICFDSSSLSCCHDRLETRHRQGSGRRKRSDCPLEANRSTRGYGRWYRTGAGNTFTRLAR